MLSKLAVRRLTKLADFMAALPKAAHEHFDMDNWAKHSDEGFSAHGYKLGDALPADGPMDCGTTACALGFAASVPSFRKAGLRIRLTKSMWTGLIGYVSDGKNDKALSDIHSASKEAAARFFDIDSDDVNILFYARHTATPKKWARHCRKFIRDNAA